MPQTRFTRFNLVKILFGCGLFVGLFYVLPIDLSFENLREQQQDLRFHFRIAPVGFAIEFALLYIVVTGLSIPISTLFMLAAGAIFGFGWGVLIASFSTAMGASLAFLFSRFFFKNWVQKKFRTAIAKVNAGLEEEGALYVFSIRLIPLFPFFLVNLALGVTRLKLPVYFITTQLGMLPLTILFVSAGVNLSRLNSPTDILSVPVVLSFALIGLFPFLAKKIVYLAGKTPPAQRRKKSRRPT